MESGELTGQILVAPVDLRKIPAASVKADK